MCRTITWFHTYGMEFLQVFQKMGKGMKKRLFFAAGAVSGALLSNYMTFRTVFARPVKTWKREVYDCVVVCGCPAADGGSPSRVMKTRVEKAVSLWQEGKAGKLIFSGAAVKNSYVEAEVMKTCALDMGVPEDAVITETEAVSTYHNMKLVKPLMEKYGFKNCIVVTNSWHLRKAAHYADKFGFDHVMCPAEEPEGTGKFYALWHYAAINLHMYLNFYRGLY